MELLRRFPLPRRLAARVWLLTLPSGLISFERRQRIPRMPLGRGRLLGLALIAGGLGVLLRSRSGARPGEDTSGLARFRERPAVGGGLLALSGVGVLTRSLVLIAYVVGLAFAFARQIVELEEPQLPGPGGGEEPWEYDEAQV